MALLRKMTCNLRHPMSLRHPVPHHTWLPLMLEHAKWSSQGSLFSATHFNALQHTATHRNTPQHMTLKVERHTGVSSLNMRILRFRRIPLRFNRDNSYAREPHCIWGPRIEWGSPVCLLSSLNLRSANSTRITGIRVVLIKPEGYPHWMWEAQERMIASECGKSEWVRKERVSAARASECGTHSQVSRQRESALKETLSECLLAARNASWNTAGVEPVH